MSELTSDCIGDLVVDALERTAFVLAETVPASDAMDNFQPNHFAKIGFTGVANGCIILAADTEFVSEVASSLLGVEPEDVDPDKEGRDALGELANIVGGSIIIEFGGEDQNYEYGLPTSLTRAQLPPEPDGTVKCYLQSECGMLCVSWVPVSDAGSIAA